MSEAKRAAAVESAYALMKASIITYRDRPVGVVAAMDPESPADNYHECFMRDFVPAALVFLLDGEHEIVRNFLETMIDLRDEIRNLDGHWQAPGVLPASFKVVRDARGDETISADFGDRAIGRVAPVDSVMWWVALLARYVEVTGDTAFAHEPKVQATLTAILKLALRDTFEVYPTLHAPEASFMIDRRLGVYGHPLEIQALFYALLRFVPHLLKPTDQNREALKVVKRREKKLREFVRKEYWLDLGRLNQIHRYKTEEAGGDVDNILNIHPQNIARWVVDWMPDRGGYLAGNIGVGRLDFRFFALGNLAAVSFGLATREMAESLFHLYEARWDDLVGRMPLKICFPALEGREWELQTGFDPKNVPWSYHNAGNWPVLLYPFTGSALRTGRADLAQRAFDTVCERLPHDSWPEYYDGRHGRLVGRQACRNQVWSATGFILSHKYLENPDVLSRLFHEGEIG